MRYYNDSKATTPQAAITSLAAFDAPVIIIVGGSDKGGSFAELGRELARRAKTVICMGDTRHKIHAEVAAALRAEPQSPSPRTEPQAPARGIRPTGALLAHPPASNSTNPPSPGQPTLMLADTLPQALHLARESAAPGDVVLLSPACASYDAFRNYEHRGQVFKEIVQAW